MLTDTDIISNLKTLRQQIGMSQEHLAFNARISVSHLSKVERGVTCPTVKTLLKLAQALGIEAADLFVKPLH